MVHKNSNKKKGSNRGLLKNSSKFRGNRHSVFKPKNRKKRKFNDDKYNQEDAKKQKIEEKPVTSSESESEEEVDDPLKKLLCTFNPDNLGKRNIAIESEEESSEEDEKNEKNEEEQSDVGEEQEDIGEEQSDIGEEQSDIGDDQSDVDETQLDGEEEQSDVDEEQSDVVEDEDQALSTDNDNEDDSLDEEFIIKNDKEEVQEDLAPNDTFVDHLCYDLSDDFVDYLTNSNEKNIENIEWPILGKLTCTLPKFEQTSMEKNKFTITEDKKYAMPGKIPKKLKNTNDYGIKSQIFNNVKPANKSLPTESDELFTPLQNEIYSIINNYQDFYFNERNFDNGEEIRFIYSLHAINHILKTRIKVLHHNAKLKDKKTEIIPDEFRDQGLVRPKVLIIVPFRDSVLKIVQMMIDILVPEEKGQVINKLRFMDDFSGGELILPKKNPKPEDYEKTFTGNCDDTFKIGIQVTKKSLKLYADFYSSDIIISSPLGLRLVVGAEGEAERDYDFLASIEMLILDQTELFLMQNWDHLIHILDHLHMQPKDSHGTDFSRIRSWTLNGWSKYYRQTLLFSSFSLPEINSIFNKKCFNYSGAVKTSNPINNGAILNVHVQVPQIYRKFYTDSFAQCIDSRFDFFINKVLPQYKDTIMKQCLIYVPNYFDYVRIRNYFKKEDISFVQICEYSKDAKVARARDIFYHADTQFLLYSERFHYFHRIRIKGIRHIIFYQPPTFPHFYSEMCNFMQEANLNKKHGSSSNMSVVVIYSKYDAHQIAGIVGTERITKMATSMKNFHMFTNTDS